MREADAANEVTAQLSNEVFQEYMALSGKSSSLYQETAAGKTRNGEFLKKHDLVGELTALRDGVLAVEAEAAQAAQSIAVAAQSREAENLLAALEAHIVEDANKYRGPSLAAKAYQALARYSEQDAPAMVAVSGADPVLISKLHDLRVQVSYAALRPIASEIAASVGTKLPAITRPEDLEGAIRAGLRNNLTFHLLMSLVPKPTPSHA